MDKAVDTEIIVLVQFFFSDIGVMWNLGDVVD
jgi:hypothetical protein